MMKESIIKKMREKRLKLTSQRLAIIDVLVERTPLHPSANTVYREAKKRTEGLSLSTVYATLNELSRQGIIRMLEFDKMENRFEGNLADHINLVCKGCNKIMDFKSPISINPKEVDKKAHFQVTETRLDFYGYCQECRKK
jgi:Fe2+ or Zn2+ uptake regulation protein